MLYIFLKGGANKNHLRYPYNTDCEAIYSQFQDSKGAITKAQKAEFLSWAEDHDKKATEQMAGAGYYQCYCKKYLKSKEGNDKLICD